VHPPGRDGGRLGLPSRPPSAGQRALAPSAAAFAFV